MHNPIEPIVRLVVVLVEELGKSVKVKLQKRRQSKTRAPKPTRSFRLSGLPEPLQSSSSGRTRLLKL